MSLLAARRVAAAAGAALYAGDRARCDVSTPPLMRPDGWTPLYLRSIEQLTAVGAAGGRGAGSGANAAAAAAASVSGEYGVAKYVFASAEPSSTCAAGVASCVMVCVEIKSSTRLQCARHRTDWTRLFRFASRTRREQSICPKISRIDFDLTELEDSEVWSGPPKPVVGFHTGSDSVKYS